MTGNAAEPPVARLPVPLTALVGRGRETATLLELLSAADTRLVTLTGPGGVGKTRLAIHVANQVTAKSRDGCWFVDLAPVRDPELVAPTVAQELGVRPGAGRSVTSTLVETLRGRRLLLVLDNFEQVLPAATWVAQLLSECPEVTVLATSREILRISGERELAVPPLPLPAGIHSRTTAEARNSEAVQLFVARARAVSHDFDVSDANVRVVVDICRRLDGLPLAIELAAARLRHLPASALLTRLEHRLPLLTAGARDQPARLRAMRDTVGWSYELLDSEEQTVFRRLAVFAGSFGLEEVGAVVGAADEADVLDRIGSLVDKSLLRRFDGVTGQPRYRMLETIREYGLEQLQALGEIDSVRRAHAECFLAMAERAARGLLTVAVQTEWLNRLDLDYDDLRTALAWFLQAGEGERAVRLASALPFYWYYRGHLSEGRHSLEQALAADQGSTAPPTARAWALTGIGLLANAQGDLPAAIARLSEAIDLWATTEEAWGAAVARGLLGGVYVGEGRYDEAAILFDEGLARFADLGNAAWVAHARFHLGAIAYARGDMASAREHCRDAATGYDALNFELDAIDPLRYLGLIACAGGNFDEAAMLFSDNLRRLRERGSVSAIATGLADIATLAARRGAYHDAARLFSAADAILTAEGAALSLPARVTYDAARADIRRTLGAADFETERSAGQSLPIDQAIKLAEQLLTASLPSHRESGPTSVANNLGLTERELEVLRLLSAGRTNPEIADELFIGHGTVRNYVSRILDKLSARTRTEAADIARRQGLI